MKIDPILERFLNKINIKSEDECWEWQDCCDIKGYGRFSLNGRTVLAHRVAYFIEYGVIPRYKNFGEVSTNNCDIVCDNCYKKALKGGD